jgi:tetratricopeptide (TPR) repeat protein
MRKTLFLLACVGFVASSAPVLADDREDCSSNDVERMIRGCTDVINTRHELKQTLAVAYHRRGIAYAAKRDFDRAIADYSKAIEIDPEHVGAYNDRGLAYTNKSDYQRAIADVTKAVELSAKSPPPMTIPVPPPVKATKSVPSAATKAPPLGKAGAPPPPPVKTTKSAPPPPAPPPSPPSAKTAAPAPVPPPKPSDTGSEAPSWAAQILNNKDMN